MDHSSLTWLYRFKRPEGQLARWLDRTQPVQLVIEHRSGTHHVTADALSRRDWMRDLGTVIKQEEGAGKLAVQGLSLL